MPLIYLDDPSLTQMYGEYNEVETEFNDVSIMYCMILII